MAEIAKIKHSEAEKKIGFLEFHLVMLFTDLLKSRPTKFFSKLNDELEGLFEEVPIIIPLPEGAPKEIPFLNARSHDNSYKLQLTRDRAIFFYSSNKEDSFNDFEWHEDKFKGKTEKVFEILKEENLIKRIGYNTKFFLKKDNPTEFIKEQFLRKDFDDLKELNIRYNRPFKDDGQEFKFNNIIKIDPAELLQKKGGEDIVQISLDINTTQNVDYNFNSERLEKFLSTCKEKNSFSEIHKILRIED